MTLRIETHRITKGDLTIIRSVSVKDLIESYRNLVGALLDHTMLHEGTDEAVADFLRSDDRAAPTLQHIRDAQMKEYEEGAP